MFERRIIISLREWAANPKRKPLVLRGARQVGKTTVIEEFAKEFDVFLHLNLERKKDRDILRTFFLFKKNFYSYLCTVKI